MRRRAAITVLAAALAAGSVSRAGEAGLVVLHTGETHAAVHPARGGARADGGLARRAGMIESVRAGSGAPVFVFDSGGFFAGGIFDRNLRGGRIDRLRTEVVIDAMAGMGYDAVAIGDEELNLGEAYLRGLIASGRLPLVCANLLDAKTGRPVARPWLVVERKGVKVGVFAVLAPEAGAPVKRAGMSLRVSDRTEAARKAVAELTAAGADVVVALSHVSECRTGALVRAVPGIDLALNGNMKSWSMPSYAAGRARSVQFSFEGRCLPVCRMSRAADGWDYRVELRRLGPDVRENRGVAALVARADREIRRIEPTESRVVADLYVRPECEFCVEPEKVLFKLARELPKVLDLRIRYIVSRSADGKLEGLHGESELAETLRQAAVRRFSPEKLAAYIGWRRLHPGSKEWEAAARKIGIDAAQVQAAVESKEAEGLVAEDVERTKRLRIGGSPTLVLNNRLHDAPITRERVLARIGSLLPDSARPAACAEAPACFSDADCVRPGYVGECVDGGTRRARRAFHRAVRVPLTVLEDSRATHSNSEAIVESLLVFLPGLDVTRVDYAAEAGRELAARHKVRRLPAYILGPEAKRARRFRRVADGFAAAGGVFIAKPGLVGSHQFIDRQRVPGRLDVFFAPGYSKAFENLFMATEGARKRDPVPEVRVRHAVYRDANGKLAMAGGISEIEEALRQVAVRERFADRFAAYLRERGKLAGSSYWRAPLVAAGLDPDEVRRLSESDWARKSLGLDADDMKGLMTGGPAVFLVSNQEVVPAAKEKDVERVLDHLSWELRLARRRSAAPQAKDEQP